MKIISAIPDGVLGYNCSECNGLCCNLNSTLYFDSTKILENKIVQYIRDYITINKNSVNIKCGKKCYFLQNTACSLIDDLKPLGCKLYPYNIWKLDDENIVIDIIPCPHIHKNSGKILDTTNDKKIIFEYIKKYNLKDSILQSKVKKNRSINIEKKINEYLLWKNEFIASHIDNYDVIQLLFVQIPINFIFLNANVTNFTQLFESYNKHYREILEKKIITDSYNLYIILRNLIIKNFLFTNYTPYNKVDMKNITISNKNEIDTFIKSKDIIWITKNS